MNRESLDSFRRAADMIRGGRRVAVFTGAGISVESGIPSFRGADGLWSRYDPRMLEIGYFREHPGRCWTVIREIFYRSFAAARPNAAHHALAAMESAGLVHSIITQNIDNLHHRAGSRVVWEFHGNSRNLVCLGCTTRYRVAEIDLEENPPTCRMCGGVLKPDFVFFGEPIPEPAATRSLLEARLSDVFLLVGASGAVMPAGMIPTTAKANGARIVEVNLEESEYTDRITDIFLQEKATLALSRLLELLGLAADT